jgi:hypothetical protein
MHPVAVAYAERDEDWQLHIPMPGHFDTGDHFEQISGSKPQAWLQRAALKAAAGKIARPTLH